MKLTIRLECWQDIDHKLQDQSLYDLEKLMESVNKIGKNEQGNSVCTIFIVRIVIKFISKRRPSRHGGKAVPVSYQKQKLMATLPKLKILMHLSLAMLPNPKKKKRKLLHVFIVVFS